MSARAGGIAGEGCNYTSGDTEKQTVVKNCFNVGTFYCDGYMDFLDGAQIIGSFNQTDSKYDQAVVENVYYNKMCIRDSSNTGRRTCGLNNITKRFRFIVHQ